MRDTDWLVIVTPDATAALPRDAVRGVIPVAAYVEAELPPGVRTIPDIYSDTARMVAVLRQIVECSRRAGDAINQIADGSGDKSLAPLAYDLTCHLAAIVADRALRLTAAGHDGGDFTCIPGRIDYGAPWLGRGDDWRAWQKDQAYHWMILRAMAGAADGLDPAMPAFLRRLRVTAGKWRQDRAAMARGGDGFHACYLARHEKVLEATGFPLQAVPSMVLDHGLRRNVVARRRIADATAAAFEPLMEVCGQPASRARSAGMLMGRFYPDSRLECRGRNRDVYAAYFDRWRVDGMVTATGQAWHDNAAYFWVECNRRDLPTVVIQHGGQYGYDDKQPGFFALDQTLPTHFASWGWTHYSGIFEGISRRAEIVPLPDPRLSAMIDGPRPENERESLLLVPLSKFRSLELRFGSIASDGSLVALRQTTADVICRAAAHFDKIVVTYRGAEFGNDPLGPMLAEMGDRVEIVSSREKPASELFRRAAAVFWDVTATGPFESLTYGLPTAVLMRRNRWAADARWAEDLFVDSGIGAYDAAAAADSLIRFARDPAAWATARARVQPALDAYALADPAWREKWTAFLGGFARG
jgi:hypothetical protein